MKKHAAILIMIAGLLLSINKIHAQKPIDPTNSDSDTLKPVPKYEMKKYWFVMLVKGKRRDEIKDTAVINKLQAGHMANITKLAAMGKLNVAGPFDDDGPWRGIFIFDAETKEEVEGYLKTDPAIAAGRLDYEIHPWWTAKGTTFK